jgi:hypothetical protein
MQFKEHLAAYIAGHREELALSHARYWIQAVEYQGRRLIMVYQKTNSLPFQNTTQRMEEQFFLNAAGKAIRWLKELTANNLIPEVKTFFDNVGDAEFIRNMREHDDEYSLGGGRNREKEMAELKEEGRTTLHMGQGVTMFRDGQILIGGRINVQKTTEAAATLAGYLVNKEHKELDKKWNWLGESRRKGLKYLYPPDKLLDGNNIDN